MDTLSGYINARVYSPNEARELLDMNPYPGGDTYENPAISPGAGDGDKDEDNDKDAPEDANKAAIRAHLRHMIGVEANRVLASAGNKRNYSGWAESFYVEWEVTFANSIESLGGDRELATTHCHDSQTELLEIFSSVPPDGLADAVSEMVTVWPDRAELLVEAITNKEPINV